MTYFHNSTNLSRRALLRGAPVAAVAVALPAVAAGSSDIAPAIEAHRSAWNAYGEANDRLEATERVERTREFAITFGSMRLNYHYTVGRVGILRSIADHFERWRETTSASLAAMGARHSTIMRKVEASRAAEREAIDEVSQAFDEDEAAVASSPYGAAERALRAANDTEEMAWVDLLALPCRTMADVKAKSEYLSNSDRLNDLPIEPEAAVALMRSFVGVASDA